MELILCEDPVLEDVKDGDGEYNLTTYERTMDLLTTEVDELAVILLLVNGSIDTDMSKVTASEMTQWGISNLWPAGREGPYGVRHGSQPVSDFGRERDKTARVQNLFEKSFPCLYPYGRGGIEADRPVNIDFKDHVRWSL
jgi:hypothetical protein